MPVSGQLPTYPSPNPTLTLTFHQLTVFQLGERWVGSCQDTYIDPRKVIGRILFKVLVTAECLAGSSSQWAY